MGREIFNFEKLEIWQEGMSLAKVVYSVAGKFPADERYGLTAQMRRCASSVPSNIAEGSGRRTDKDFLRFAYLARGSLLELVTQIKLAKSLQFLDEKTTATMLERAGKLERFRFPISLSIFLKANSFFALLARHLCCFINGGRQTVDSRQQNGT